MENIIISSEELKKKNDGLLPLKAIDFSSYNFWYYTSLQTANLILLNRCIHISNIDSMNDLDERNIHESDKEFVHCLCFCNSDTEKIPMWYLYAGITGRGVSIGLTPSVMISFLKSIDKVYTVDDKIELRRGSDFDIEFGWVFYRKKEQPSQVMYKRKWYALSDPDNFEANNYFIKSYPWEYEKEFRIVFHNKTGTPYDQIKIKIDEVYQKLKLKLAPEFTKESFEEMIPSLPGFLKYASRVPSYSKLGINMQLCKRNINGFINYFETDFKKDETNREIDTNTISEFCRIIRTGSKCGAKTN